MPDIFGIFASSSVAGLFLSGAVLSLACSFRLMRFPDITVEGSFLLGAALWSACIRQGLDTTSASIIAAACGALGGVSTAFLHRAFGIDRFLAGILVTAACYSIALLGLGTSNVGLFQTPSPFVPLFDMTTHSFAFGLTLALALAAIAILFFRSRPGLRARCAASNPGLLTSLGGRPLISLAFGLGVTNAIAAISGMAFARFQGFVDVGMGQGVLIVALAALAIGEGLTWWLHAPRLWVVVVSAIVGSILYQFVLSLTLATGAPAAATKLLSAAIVIVFLAAQRGRRPTEVHAV